MSKNLGRKKRANIICSTMSVAHVDDEDIHVEKVSPSGDMYIGQWASACPNGYGKCLWSDGCMYVGDWVNGKKTGKGKFSWPSGATYEGQFKNGCMEGDGVYIGSSNDTYKGTWSYNMRHGKGIQTYENSDYYEGQWRRGEVDGKGRYQWRNGNQYMGYWKQGKMHGLGTMVWRNGNQYDGNWEEGLVKGNGTFRWVDGSFYVGVWSDNIREQRGTYYTSSSQKESFDRDPHEVYLVNLSECSISPVERIPVFPSQKMMNWQSYSCKDRLLNEDSASDSTSESCSECLGSERGRDGEVGCDDLGMLRPAKRQGLPISEGHKNYELMLNLQLGIRHSVGRTSPVTSLDLKSSAFNPRDRVWTRFPPEGSKNTPPHHSCEFKWKDYCPLVFRTLRKLFMVDPADYMMSLCGNDALRELSSPGKSGSFFYLTSDDKYMIKTLKKSEVKVFKRMIPAYYNHVRSHENTLLTKFFGLHCVKMTGNAQKKVRFVIMGNLFCTEYTIHRRFDLKGSSHGRSTAKPESEIDSTTTLKDLDLNFIFRLHKSWFQEFCRQVIRDCELLEQEKIMDYSLLVGIHFREIEPLNATEEEVAPALNFGSGKLGAARAEFTNSNGEPTGEYCNVVLVLGIIDILQDYDISKKLEHAYKSFQYDATSISAVDPKQYSKRFRDFVFRIFTQGN